MPVRTIRRFARACLVVALAASQPMAPGFAQTTLKGGATYNAPPPSGAPPGGDVFSSNGGSRGNTTYRTGTQTFQPTDAPCASPYGCGRGGPYQGGTGSDVYCQDSPGMPQRGPYSHTGTNTPCGLGGGGSAPGYGAPVQQQGPKQPRFYFFYINGINTPYQGIVRQPPGSRSHDPGGTYAYESGRMKAMLVDSPETYVPGTTSVFGGESYNQSGKNPLSPRSAGACGNPLRIADWIACNWDRVRGDVGGFALGDLAECLEQTTKANIAKTAQQDEVTKLVRIIEQDFARDTAPGSTVEPYFIVVAHSQGNFFAEGVAYRLLKPDSGPEEAAGPFIGAHRFGIISLGSPTQYDSLDSLLPGFVAQRLKHLTRADDAILTLQPLKNDPTTLLEALLRPCETTRVPMLPRAAIPELATSTKRPFSANAPALWPWRPNALNEFLAPNGTGLLRLLNLMSCRNLPPLVTPFMNAHLLDNYLSGPSQTPAGVTATPAVLAPADRTIPPDLSNLLVIGPGTTEERVSGPPGTPVTAIVQSQVRELKRTLLADPASTRAAPFQAQGTRGSQGADLGRAASSMVLKLFGQ